MARIRIKSGRYQGLLVDINVPSYKLGEVPVETVIDNKLYSFTPEEYQIMPDNTSEGSSGGGFEPMNEG